MVEFLHYLLSVSICSGVFYLFYYGFLRKLTLFKANRIYLLGSLIGSLLIPLLHLHITISSGVIHQPILQAFAMDNYISDDFTDTQLPVKHAGLFRLIEVVYAFGVLCMLLRMCLFLFRLFRLVRTSQTTRIDKVRLVLLGDNFMLFSFFHFLFIPKQKTVKTESPNVFIAHEKVHIRELHSIDLMLVEIIAAFLWFNPFVFFFRHSIKVNHEYIADAEVIRSGIHPVDYLTTLANEVFRNHSIGLTSNFNYSLTKKRLLMITKINTSKKAAIRFLILLPLVTILLLAFVKNTSTESGLLPMAVFSEGAVLNSDIPSISPLKEKDILITSGYGWRVHPIFKKKVFHVGMDMKAPEGTPVYASGNGVIELVTETKNAKGKIVLEGKYILIRHNDQYESKYTHLSGFAVIEGNKVSIGQLIGYVGKTGMATGTHLHYEVIKAGKNVDPKNYMPVN